MPLMVAGDHKSMLNLPLFVAKHSAEQSLTGCEPVDGEGSALSQLGRFCVGGDPAGLFQLLGCIY